MTAQPQMTPQQMDAQATSIVLGNCQPIWLKIASITNAQYPYVAGQAQTINLPITNLGIVRKLVVKLTATVAQGAAETQTASTFGGANALSQVILTDLNNLTRINTTGWHLNLLGTARRQLASGAAFTSDNPNGLGSNYALNTTPQSVTVAQTLSQFWELPLAYSDTDLRGAMFANVNNATSNLQLTLNPNFFVSSTGNATQAVYKSSTAQLGQITSYTLEVWQETLDQLPRDANNNFILPTLSLQTQYNIMNVVQTGLAVGADFSLPYSNLRQYLSSFVVLDNGGTLNAGADLNYISMTAANSMAIFKMTPPMLQYVYGRWAINDDWPKGVYYIPSRVKPISTANYGNIQLNINPSTVNAGAQLLIGYESMIMTQQLQAAGSVLAN